MRAYGWDGDGVFERWLARARAGHCDGFDALVRAFEGPLAGFARARRVEDPDGVVNEVFVRVFGSIDRFSGDESDFRAWIFQIARNLVIDQSRARARRVVEYATAPVDMPTRGVQADIADGVDEDSRIEAMLETLSPDQREVLILRIVSDLSVDDTAQIMGRSPGSVRVLQHRALARLRNKSSLDL